VQRHVGPGQVGQASGPTSPNRVAARPRPLCWVR
jgi:hypothetical protein